MAEELPTKSDTALREEAVLAFWKERGIFEKTLEQDAPRGEFVFYDGPPFATGLPHWGSLLSSISKDVFGRYKTMRGYRVPRRWGWDCHGLPIEHMIEKKLGLKTKKDILELGIDRFNAEARAAVLRYADDWKKYVDRVGRWVDFDHSYKTMDNTYIESVWWALKKIHDDGRLYEGRKVLLYCPRCETPLSKAEIAMDNSYKDVVEKEAVYVKFKLAPGQQVGEFTTDANMYVLAWTTTPWTLPANMALAVGEDIEYIRFSTDETATFSTFPPRPMNGPGTYIMGKEAFLRAVRENQDDFSETVRSLLMGSCGVDAYEENKRGLAMGREEAFKACGISVVRGTDLVGLSYESFYDVPKAKAMGSEKAWTILPADFVTTEEGTGVVHIAPMYGEDDYSLGLAHDLPIVPLLDQSGTFNPDAPEFVRGVFYKKGGTYVMEDLKKRGLLFAPHEHTHSYPHCYRCGTPLIYNALTSWFIDIQSVKERLLKANEDVSWYPAHLKHGRFKNIVEGAPDWTISRNRFWASPLPVWKHERTGAPVVIGSLAELTKRTKCSGNTYLMVRHGQAESNVQGIVSSTEDLPHPLTEEGMAQARAAGRMLKGRGITKIVASPLVRTRETAALIAEELGIPTANIILEPRFKEWQLGAFSGKPVGLVRERCPSLRDRFTKSCGEGAETLVAMKRRVGDALYDLERTCANETILIVAHEYTVWLAACVAAGATLEECIALRGTREDYVANGEIVDLPFVPLPHNADHELDLHRPYIDELALVAEDGARLVRVPEVVDCWVESGAMPFASEHYPHEHKEVVERRYPGDFIAEYIAQTRTWFYYMHTLGVLLFGASSFKNCVTTGTLLAADGAKISKSKQNYTDPLEDMDRYGADAGRLYVMGSVVMSAEDVAFKEEELREAHNRFVNMLWNSFKFYELFAAEALGTTAPASEHVLDRWVLARLAETAHEVTVCMDSYDTVRAVRAMREFVADLSQWYIRRSRDRFKSEDGVDRAAAITTTRTVLDVLSRLIAPVAPFLAESVYRGVGGTAESVHLDVWPEVEPLSVEAKTLSTDMAEVRRLASLALEARQRTGIKVRQPLAMVTFRSTLLEGKGAYADILADELNVKRVVFDGAIPEEVIFDTVLTPELAAEGIIRELVRAVQDLRKKIGLVTGTCATLTLDTDTEGRAMVEAARAELGRVAGITEIVYGAVNGGGISLTIGTARLGVALNAVAEGAR